MKPDWQIPQTSRVMLVTGMHRSGTSMLMRLINLMGVQVGEHLVRALPGDNDAGFWEHRHLIDLNEQLLEHFMGGHLSLVCPPENYLSLPVTAHYQRKLSGILRRDFAHAPYWGIKDPRISRLISLWQGMLSSLGAKPAWVISVRHPAEVADSLMKRNGITREKALLLWLDHNLKAELHTRGQKRAFVYYPDVLEDWKGALRRIARLTGFAWPRGYEEAEADVREFLKPALRRQQANSTADIPAWAARAFHVLQTAARSPSGEVDTAALDTLKEDYDAIAAPLQEEITRLREITAGQTQDIEDLKRHLELLFHSLSWRITTPVRAVKKAARWMMSAPEAKEATGEAIGEKAT